MQIRAQSQALKEAARQIRSAYGLSHTFSERRASLQGRALCCGAPGPCASLASFLGGWADEMAQLARNADRLAAQLEAQAALYDQLEFLPLVAGPGPLG
ncbi:MAG: hypothetical protein NVSMB32_14020 [Actinomycetota bacterium]